MNKELLNKIENQFKTIFPGEPMLVRAPGRINLIGEHTDYNNGFVLPTAVSPAIYFAIALRADTKVVLVSADFNSRCEFDIHQTEKPAEQWASYLFGVTKLMQNAGAKISGYNCVFGGDVPLGAGMSSSAALESGLALALNELSGAGFDRMKLAKIGQQSEHEFVGVKCGIMDQFASLFGQKGKCVRLDCRSLEYEYSKLETGEYTFILTDTKVKHSLASSEYNKRRNECAQGVKVLNEKFGNINSLRDATIEQSEDIKSLVSETVYNRCKYAIEENQRVIDACKALNNNDLTTFGQLLYGSHNGLSKLYNVSCKELDFLVDQTVDMDYVLGSRMMGGGFGGCTLSLIKANKIEEYKSVIAPAYKKAFNLDCKFYAADAENGCEVIKK